MRKKRTNTHVHREEKLRKKREAARVRRQTIREDPDQRASYLQKERERYQRRKLDGRIRSASELTAKEIKYRRQIQNQWKRNSRMKKKAEMASIQKNNEGNSNIPLERVKFQSETREEARLRRKGESARRIRQKIRDDPVLHEIHLQRDREKYQRNKERIAERDRQRYQRRKLNGEVRLMSDLTEEEKRIRRGKVKEWSRRSREKKKKLSLLQPPVKSRDLTEEEKRIRREKRKERERRYQEKKRMEASLIQTPAKCRRDLTEEEKKSIRREKKREWARRDREKKKMVKASSIQTNVERSKVRMKRIAENMNE